MKKRRIAVLMSGGMDSYCVYRIAQYQLPDAQLIPLAIDYGQPYALKERRALDTLFKGNNDLIYFSTVLCTPYLDNVPTVENQEIYGRNLLMAFYGGLIADETWMSALETEINPETVRDKQPEFRDMMSALMTFVMKSKRLETRLVFPLQRWSKAEMLATAHHFGVSHDELRTTVSCYDPEYQNCGRCLTCHKRWLASNCIGLEEKYHFHPYEDNPYGQRTIAEMREHAKKDLTPEQYSLTHYSWKRMVEAHFGMVRAGFPGVLSDEQAIWVVQNNRHGSFLEPVQLV